jgi:citrate lyase beta subunit
LTQSGKYPAIVIIDPEDAVKKVAKTAPAKRDSKAAAPSAEAKTEPPVPAIRLTAIQSPGTHPKS